MPLTDRTSEFFESPTTLYSGVVSTTTWDSQRFVRIFALCVAIGTVGLSLAAADGVALICSGTALAIALVSEAVGPR